MTPRFFLMCGFTFTVFLSLFQLLPTAPFRILQLGGSKLEAGLFLGVLTYASALSAPLTGALADRMGRVRMLLVASLAIAGFSAAYAAAASVAVLVVLVFFHGLFWSGLLSASAAYMTSLLPAARRAEGIAYWGMSTVFATAFAPALGLWLFQHGWSWVCASVGLLDLAMAAIAWNLPETEPPKPRAGGFFTRDLVEWRVLVVSLSLFLCTFGYGGITSFVALYADQSGIAPKSIYFTVFSLTVLLTRPFSGRLADAVGHKRVLVPCLGCIVVAFAVLAASGTRAGMVTSAVFFGFGFGNMYPVYVAHVMKYVDPERRGGAFGGILAAFDTGIGTGSIVIGWIVERHGFAVAYGAAAVLASLSIPFFLASERLLVRGTATVQPETPSYPR